MSTETVGRGGDTERLEPVPGFRCVVCGGAEFALEGVLSPELITAWNLDSIETRYLNRQQGFHCTQCRSTLRCMALATAIHRLHGWIGTFADFASSPHARALDVLEVNEAGGLAKHLARLPSCRLAAYPAVDMRALPFGESTFDLVVHSDTLEHVEDPRAGLAECRRVLKPGGACAYTVPIVVGRLTRSRAGLPESVHGDPGDRHVVHTEFGADAWRCAIDAGFAECRIVPLDSPAAHALIAIR